MVSFVEHKIIGSFCDEVWRRYVLHAFQYSDKGIDRRSSWGTQFMMKYFFPTCSLQSKNHFNYLCMFSESCLCHTTNPGSEDIPYSRIISSGRRRHLEVWSAPSFHQQRLSTHFYTTAKTTFDIASISTPSSVFPNPLLAKRRPQAISEVSLLRTFFCLYPHSLGPFAGIMLPGE